MKENFYYILIPALANIYAYLLLRAFYFFLGSSQMNRINGVLDFLVYIRFICHAGTISLFLNLLGLSNYISFFAVFTFFVLMSYYCDNVVFYKMLTKRNIGLSSQFRQGEALLKYQIIDMFFYYRALEVSSASSILISDSENISYLFDDTNKNYINNLLNYFACPTNSPSLITTLLIVEIINIITYYLVSNYKHANRKNLCTKS